MYLFFSPNDTDSLLMSSESSSNSFNYVFKTSQILSYLQPNFPDNFSHLNSYKISWKRSLVSISLQKLSPYTSLVFLPNLLFLRQCGRLFSLILDMFSSSSSRPWACYVSKDKLTSDLSTSIIQVLGLYIRIYHHSKLVAGILHQSYIRSLK